MDNWWHSNPWLNEIAEYAIIETIIDLAYQEVADPIGKSVKKLDIFLKDVATYTLDLTYVPIFNEITTKYVSNMPNRKALNWEKKFNLTDRVVSYQENEEVLRNEMEKKVTLKNYLKKLIQMLHHQYL